MDKKQKTLEALIKNCGSLGVAYSGGADSTFLLAVARSVLEDSSNLLAVSVVSPLQKERDIDFAEAFARENAIPFVRVYCDDMMTGRFLENPPDRCYLCKKIIFRKILETARREGIATVAHGENADDRAIYRPGSRAAHEMGVIAPLAEAGFTKDDIRKRSRDMGLPTWNKPASGCLATRIPYGAPITPEKLEMVAAAEAVMADMGFLVCRVRHHGELAKIEVPEESLDHLLVPSVRRHLVKLMKYIGFTYVSLDLEGHGSGRLDRSIESLIRSA